MSDQLNLGEGIFGEVVDFDEHVVVVPMALVLDKDVPAEAQGLYLVMKSFGRRSEASLAAYAERCCWTEDYVRKLQKLLVTTAWLTLLAEGRPGKAGEPGIPRRWWLGKSKGEQPPLSAFTQPGQRVAQKPTLVQGSDSVEGSTKAHPKHGLSRDRQLSSSKRTAAAAAPFVATDGSSWAELLQDYVDAYQVAKGTPGLNPELSGADFGQLKKLAKHKLFTRELYKARLANMKYHDFHARLEFSLAYFCTKFREFDDSSVGILQAKAGTNRRGGRYLPVQQVDDFEG